jgi:hypothetical protein
MKGILVKYALPLLIVAVASHQFYMVYQKQLTRWKGGGFGMYSEMHPLTREVWIGKRDSMWLASNPKITIKAVAYKANRIRFKPNEKQLEQFAAFAAKKYHYNSLLVQIWEPVLNPKDNSLSRKLIREVQYAGKP